MVTERAQRLAQRLNQALGTLLDRHDDLYLLGEDIADPYGGAFGVTRGLSSRHPQRVRNTPISENGIIGVANGLAICGNRVIVEVMFGDFVALGLDQILNVAAKSVSMYGHRRPMRVVVRCPVGGHRGYGPTHSQSLQKHFIGIPNLSLYELSVFHDPELLVERAFDSGEPAVIFEPKTMYAQRVCGDGRVDDLFRHEFLDAERNWVHVHQAGATGRPGGTELVILAPGGTSGAALEAARALATEDGANVRLLVPARLYPVDVGPVLDLLSRAALVCVAEESTPGGTWGTEIARHVHERLWSVLPRPVMLLSSRDSIIPAAPHLERQVLLQPADITSALRAALATQPSVLARAAGPPSAVRTAVTVPKLNNNDVSYVLLSWLAPDGEPVKAGDPIAEIDTAKAVQELAAQASGVLRHAMPEGAEIRPGDQIGVLTAAGETSESEPVPPPGTHAAGSEPGTVELTRGQQLVAKLVSSAREVPDAFAVRRVRLDAVADLERAIDEREAEPVGLLELLVKIVGDLRGRFPMCFASLTDALRARIADAAHVGVTFDAGHGLFIPVVRAVENRSVGEIADQLADFKLRAFRASFIEDQLRGANIAISWNHDPQVVLVQPVILPGLACVVSVGGPLDEVRLDEDGRPVRAAMVHIGLAHDHRLVNGREAVAFLDALATAIEDRDLLGKLAEG